MAYKLNIDGNTLQQFLEQDFALEKEVASNIKTIQDKINSLTPADVGFTTDNLDAPYAAIRAWAFIRCNDNTPTIMRSLNIYSVEHQGSNNAYRVYFETPIDNYIALVSGEIGGNGNEILGVYRFTSESFYFDFPTTQTAADIYIAVIA